MATVPQYKKLILDAFVNYEATRISNINLLKIRREEISRITPEYQNLIKQQLKQIWNEKYTK